MFRKSAEALTRSSTHCPIGCGPLRMTTSAAPKSPPSLMLPTVPADAQVYFVDTGMMRRSVSRETKTAAQISLDEGVPRKRHRHVTMGYSLGFQAMRLKIRICASTPFVLSTD